MLVSNHSYGNVCGWDYDNTQWIWHGNVDLSSTEDNKFGLYNDAAVLWDQIVFDNPFYLPFKSAGNDRGDYPSNNLPRVYWDNSTGTYKNFTGSIPPADGSFDCISTNGVAKNIMTIGAVEKIAGGWNGANSVVMSSFSGWGPTDDGRIKPDIVAAGVNLTSSYSASNSEYGTISGTSMSSPNASGSAILIQQHYNNLMGKFMRASTLKGLIIQTADEAGTSTGPDYSFGWGLMNTAKAVQTISDSNANNIIESQMAANLTPFNKTIVSDGTKPLRITLCWTDVPGTASNWDKLDDAALKLVNDLDVRLIRVSDNQTFLPYILNPANPNLPATTGDNVRDNVEQIYLAAPSAGGYTVRVTSKKALFNNLSQSFSLIISGISPKPAANFFASAQNSCVGTNITFTNNSSSSNSYIWYFPGGTPSTSTSTNPVVSYSKPGVYAVALKAVGISGTDSIYKKDFIKIGGVSLPFNETFETSSITSSLWTSNNVNNDTFGFKKSTQTSGTSPGNSVMAINIYDNLTLNRRYQLISPILDLKGMQNANLSFQHAYTRYDLSSKDSLIVSISSNCGSSWTRLASLTESRETNNNKMATFTGEGEDAQTSTVRFIPKNSSEWCSSNINSTPCNNLNLASYLGQSNVVLRFEVFASGGNNLFLDNINVAGTPFKPIAGFSIPSLVCNNQKTKFTDTSLNNPTSWNWTVSGPANFNSTERNPEFNFTQTGTYTIKLKVSNQTGTDSVTMMNAFEVKASPASPTITNTGKLTLCNNDSAVLITSGTNLQWYKDSSAISAANGISYKNKEAGKIAVRTTAANGCSAQSEILEFKVGTSPAVPTVTSSLTANQFCEGGSFTLT
jgi:PKD repeat protein